MGRNQIAVDCYETPYLVQIVSVRHNVSLSFNVKSRMLKASYNSFDTDTIALVFWNKFVKAIVESRMQLRILEVWQLCSTAEFNAAVFRARKAGNLDRSRNMSGFRPRTLTSRPLSHIN
jgi:hypothetical protein